MDIKSFKKTKIDLSLLGFDMNGDFELYYYTPKKRTNTISGIEAVLFKVKTPSFLTRAFLQEYSIFFV